MSRSMQLVITFILASSMAAVLGLTVGARYYFTNTIGSVIHTYREGIVSDRSSLFIHPNIDAESTTDTEGEDNGGYMPGRLSAADEKLSDASGTTIPTDPAASTGSTIPGTGEPGPSVTRGTDTSPTTGAAAGNKITTDDPEKPMKTMPWDGPLTDIERAEGWIHEADILPPIGMENLGNTCYFNSAIQSLLSIPKIVSYFRSHKFDKDTQELSYTFQSFIGKYAKLTPGANVLKPEVLLALVMRLGKERRFSYQFIKKRQEDSQELLLSFVQAVTEELISPKHYFRDLFLFRTFVERVCLKCHTKSVVRTYDTSCSLDVNVDVQDAIGSIYFAEPTIHQMGAAFSERPEGRDCDECGMKTSFSEQWKIENGPICLILTPKNGRDFAPGEGGEINRKLIIGDFLYHLVGMIRRDGNSVNSGHYYAYFKRGSQWFEFNDSMIIPLEEELVPTTIGAITTIFYTLVNAVPTGTPAVTTG